MILSHNKIQYEFESVPLRFEEGTFTNVFADKNNKTLEQTLKHRRYAALGPKCERFSESEFKMPIGSFLKRLKSNGDGLYKNFLNKYGDLSYSRFRIENESVLEARGLYIFLHDGHLLYVGRCRDSFRKRINQGYGRIAPKNCFLDGQATNCHINSLITNIGGDNIEFKFCKMSDLQTITKVEEGLISDYRPPWNIQGL